MPPCTTKAIFHLRTSLDIKSISQLYEESHCVSHTRTRLLGDNLVNHALDCKVNRESQFTREKSVTVTAEIDYQQALRINTVGGDRTMFGDLWEREERELNTDISEHVKISTTIRTEKEFVDKINTLVKQGDLLRLAESEKWDAIWILFVYDKRSYPP